MARKLGERDLLSYETGPGLHKQMPASDTWYLVT